MKWFNSIFTGERDTITVCDGCDIGFELSDECGDTLEGEDAYMHHHGDNDTARLRDKHKRVRMSFAAYASLPMPNSPAPHR